MADKSEDEGIHFRAIRRGALAIAGGIVFAVGGSWWLLHILGPAANTAQPPAAIPAPRLLACRHGCSSSPPSMSPPTCCG
jgi:hypothetical protein